MQIEASCHKLQSTKGEQGHQERVLVVAHRVRVVVAALLPTKTAISDIRTPGSDRTTWLWVRART